MASINTIKKAYGEHAGAAIMLCDNEGWIPVNKYCIFFPQDKEVSLCGSKMRPKSFIDIEAKESEVEIINDVEKQMILIRAMIEYLYGWLDDNPEVIMSIHDSINYNTAYVEVSYLAEINSNTHENILSSGICLGCMGFKEAFEVLESSFKNIIFNQ